MIGLTRSGSSGLRQPTGVHLTTLRSRFLKSLCESFSRHLALSSARPCSAWRRRSTAGRKMKSSSWSRATAIWQTTTRLPFDSTSNIPNDHRLSSSEAETARSENPRGGPRNWSCSLLPWLAEPREQRGFLQRDKIGTWNLDRKACGGEPPLKRRIPARWRASIHSCSDGHSFTRNQVPQSSRRPTDRYTSYSKKRLTSSLLFGRPNPENSAR